MYKKDGKIFSGSLPYVELVEGMEMFNIRDVDFSTPDEASFTYDDEAGNENNCKTTTKGLLEMLEYISNNNVEGAKIVVDGKIKIAKGKREMWIFHIDFGNQPVLFNEDDKDTKKEKKSK